jgi:hypothetical protein
LNVNMLCLPEGDRRRVELRPVAGVDDWWRPETGQGAG